MRDEPPLDYESIFRNAPVPAVVLDGEHRVLAANGAHKRMSGKSEEELIGCSVHDAFPESAERRAALAEVFDRVLEGETVTFADIPYTIEVDGTLEERFFTASHAPLRGLDGRVTHLVQYAQDVTDQRRVREFETAILAETQHRIGNLFAVVHSLARQTARRVETVDDFLRGFERDLTAFFGAQKTLQPDARVEADLRDLVEAQLTGCAPQGMERVRMGGGPMPLTGLQAQAMSMALHELCVNSLKHGALGRQDGEIEIGWGSTEAGGFRFSWVEPTEAAVGTPGDDAEGYGTILLTRILPRQLGGEAQRRLEADRFVYELTAG